MPFSYEQIFYYIKENFHTFKHTSVKALTCTNFFWKKYDFVCCRLEVRNVVKHLNVGFFSV